MSARRTRPDRTWHYRPALVPERQRELAHAFDLHPVVAQLLHDRLGGDLELAESFLCPTLARLDDPASIPGMAAAVDVLLDVVRDGAPVAIFGDYDVDGITGTAILSRFLERSGARSLPEVPNRSEGYGLSARTVKSLVAREAAVIVTVDNGITAREGADAAREAGVPLVVTDHHSFDPTELPDAAALVHPGLGEARGWRDASGAGVALALAIALRRGLREVGWYGGDEPRIDDLLELAAMGTVADMVPLSGANRIIVHEGLARLGVTATPGVRALAEVSGFAHGTLDEQAVAFGLGPRINAAGRVGDARRALRLLLTDDGGRAEALAGELDRANRSRQRQEQQVLEAVEILLDADPRWRERPLIFAASPEWNHGVLGIVAGRLARRLHRPAILFAVGEDAAKGSARSIPEVDLMERLAAAREHASSLGGHAQAAGMTVPPGKLGAFRRAVEASLRAVGGPEVWRPSLTIDAVLPVHEVSEGLLAQLDRLAPFGMGNPRPLFASDAFTPTSPRLFKGKHIGFGIPTARGSLRAIGFRMPELYPLPAGPVRVAYRPARDNWQGRQRIQLLIEDLTSAPL